MMNRLTIFLLLTSLMFFNCGERIISNFNSDLDLIENKYASDKSIAIFDAELINAKGDWILRGETTSMGAKEETLAYTKSILDSGEFQDSLIVLPHPNLGADTVAIVNVSVANLRRKPSVGAELVDQVIMGDRLRVLKKERNYYLVQTAYKYLGWVTRYSIEPRTNWNTTPKVYTKALYSAIYSKSDNKSTPVTDVVLNTTLELLNSGNQWTNVRLPDGRLGYIQNSDVTVDVPSEISVEKLIVTAKSMMGVPYLWGGSSSKMNDCSGFTQTVFLANGLQLPRDARQQALVGKTVDFDHTFSNVLPGDLVFFGSSKRITHVGISLGGYNFIHQDGYVMISSFDESAENYSQHRRNGLQIIKRVF